MGTTTDRQETILQAAQQLFAAKGIGGTTVREIGEEAGVFSGSLYHYFRSKDAIVTAILERYMTDIQERFSRVVAGSATPEETVRGLISSTLAVIEAHPHPTAIYQQDRRYLREHGLLETVDTPSRQVREHWMEAIEKGVADGTFRADVPAETFYRALRDALWASRHWPHRPEYSHEEFTEQMVALFLAGFRSSASRG